MKVFYSSDYVLSGHDFDTTRKAKSVADSLMADPIPGVDIMAPMPLIEGQIVEVHSASYIKAVRTGNPVELAESQGFKWDKGLWNMVCASNGGVVDAAFTALNEGVAGSLSSGLHHARVDRGDGFCTFNGLAIACHFVSRQAHARKFAKRILVLDFDAHCGGGTYSLLGKRSCITIADVSVDEYDRYEISKSSSRHSLEIVMDARFYLETIMRRFDKLSVQHANRPFDLCLYNAGMDPFEENIRHGGLKGINQGVLRAREEMVFRWCQTEGIPIAFVLAGGYADSEISQKKLTDLHRMTIVSAAGIAK